MLLHLRTTAMQSPVPILRQTSILEKWTASYAWTRNGTSAGGSSSTYSGSVSIGDVIGCTVTLTDNYGASDSSSTDVNANRGQIRNVNLFTTVGHKQILPLLSQPPILMDRLYPLVTHGLSDLTVPVVLLWQ